MADLGHRGEASLRALPGDRSGSGGTRGTAISAPGYLGSGVMGVAGCGFCDVVEGRVEVAMVATTEHTLAFLDRSPVFHGHTLVISREHHETLIDLPRELL